MLKHLYSSKEIIAYNRIISFLMKKGKRDKAISILFSTLSKVFEDLKKNHSHFGESKNIPFFNLKLQKNPKLVGSLGIKEDTSLQSQLGFSIHSNRGPFFSSQSTKPLKILGFLKPMNEKRIFSSFEENEERMKKPKNLNFSSLKKLDSQPEFNSKKNSNISTKELINSSYNSSKNSSLNSKQKAKNLAKVFSILYQSLQNVQPYLEIRKIPGSRKSRYMPSIISKKRQETLAIRWIIERKKKKKNSNNKFEDCLASELLDGYHKQGVAIQKRNELHKIAYSNRTSLRFRW